MNQKPAETSKQKSIDIDLPLELVLNVNKSNKEDEYIAKNLITFFDLSLDDLQNQSNKKINQIDLFKTKKLIDYLNFIRFNHFTESNQSESNQKQSNKTHVPSYSIVLLTNSPNQKVSINQNEIDENKQSSWSYHHKIELNDDNGQTIARQIFFKLNSFNILSNSKQVPLCCRSNWIAPFSDISNSFPKKYITRLNINCKNYDLMLFFYRLLFDKYPNYSKKDFSLFILVQNSHKIKLNNYLEQISIEFQLSLKYDSNVNVNKNTNTSLIYKINDRLTFENVIRLLDGFVEELEKDRVYSVLDPDHNRIYLVDCSNKTLDLTNIFNTSGLAENYFAQLSSGLKLNSEISNNFSPNSNSSSSSETCSFDSGKDSGNWSCSTFSANNLKHNLNQQKLNLNNKKYDLNLNKNLNYFSNQKDRYVNMNHNKNINNNEYLNDGCKNFIKRFNSSSSSSSSNAFNNLLYQNRPMSSMSHRLVPSYYQRKTKKKQHVFKNVYSDEESEDYDEDSEEDDERELKNLLRKASNNSMYALNALAYRNKNFKNRTNQKITNNNRSLSALNEPYSTQSINNSNNQIKLKGVLTNNSTSLNRKKSKSVTFMDAIGMDQIERPNSVHHFRHEYNNQSNRVLNPRSKSTTPFIRNGKYSSYIDDVDNCYVIADVDDYSTYGDFIRLKNNQDFNVFEDNNYKKINYKNSLIDPRSDRIRVKEYELFRSNNAKKPSVGITAETRFRRSHTLDMIRSTKMPLNTSFEQQLENQCFLNKPNNANINCLRSNANYYCNSFNKNCAVKTNLPVAKF